VIKAVVFDFFGVISSDEYWQFVGVEKGQPTTFRDFTDEVNLGKIDWQNFLQKIADAKHTTLETVKKVYDSEQLNPQIISLIDRLHTTHKTGLLTNAHHEYIARVIEAAHPDSLFDSIVISSEVGVIKPDPRIYEIMIDRLGVKPEEIIYIDDQSRQVEGAEAVGIKAILYQNYQQLIEELNKLL